MATIRLQMPDAWVPRVVAAFCGTFGYEAVLEDGKPNPETKGNFAERQMREWVKGVVMAWEGQIAAQAAATDAQRVVERNLTITG